MQKHPETTIKTLKSIFKDDYLKGFKRLGFICSEEEISNNTLKKGRKPTEDELRRWYKIDHEDAWLVSGDGIRFVVSSEITRDSADKVKQIAENDGWEILVKD
jgi:hypothetical protein